MLNLFAISTKSFLNELKFVVKLPWRADFSGSYEPMFIADGDKVYDLRALACSRIMSID